MGNVFGCCKEGSGAAAAVDPAADQVLLMPEEMLLTFFARVRRQHKDVEREAAGGAVSLAQFEAINARCHQVLEREHAAVMRSYKKSQQFLARQPPAA